MATLGERFANHHELARLPYFELRDGRLVLADRSIGPIIDVHTHLALCYGLMPRVDLLAAPGPTKHYLPLERPVDLGVYMNRNFVPGDLRRLMFDLGPASLTPWGMRATHTAPNLMREMDELGIARSILLPIDFPVRSQNAERFLEVAARHEELVSLGSVHPLARDVAGKLDRQRAAGARGVKFHPATQLVAPDSRLALRLYRLCGERGLPVFFHCGPVGIEPRIGRRLSRVKRYRAGIERNPSTTFVLGHSGALEMAQALELAKTYRNVYLEVSSQSIGNVRRIVEEGPPDRIMFGTDWPFYHQATQLAKVLLVTEGMPELRARILWGNAARLFAIDRSIEVGGRMEGSW